MDSYKFTYKDVLKRHERMINRIEKWEIHALAIIMLVVTAFFTFSTFCFGAETEEVQATLVPNLYISSNANYFQSANNHNIRYIEVEKGYRYSITNLNDTYALGICFSNDIPEVNKPIYEFYLLPPGETYSFVANNYDYFYFDYLDFNYPLTREKIEGQTGAVTDLVENVGINQIWDVFGSGINFVYVVIIVAFGIFLIALAIRKVSKGKSEF